MIDVVDHVVELGGVRCLILRDEAGAAKTSPDALIVQRDALADGAHLWLSSLVMEEATTKNGLLPVYGLWQVLLASGFIKEGYDVHVVETSEEGDGHYLLKMGKTWQVGVLFQGDLQGLPDEALKRLDEGQFNVNIIEAELSELVRPAARVLSAAETAALAAKQKKEFNLRLLAIFSFTLMMVYAIDSYYGFQHKVAKIEYEAEQTLLRSIESNIQILKQSHALEIPNQEQAARSVWFVVSKLPAAAVSAEGISLTADGGSLVVKPEFARLTFSLPADQYDVRVNSKGEAIVSWSLYGGANTYDY